MTLARPIHQPSAATPRLAASAALSCLRGLGDLSEVASAALGRESLPLPPFAAPRSRSGEYVGMAGAPARSQERAVGLACGCRALAWADGGRRARQGA